MPSVLSDPDTLQHSSFFSEQLTGFEVWLKTTSTLISQEHTSVDAPACPPPEQLPIVLQVCGLQLVQFAVCSWWIVKSWSFCSLPPLIHHSNDFNTITSNATTTTITITITSTTSITTITIALAPLLLILVQLPQPQQTPPRQVLLSQVHRLRALDLLASFLDLGAWAVNLVCLNTTYTFKLLHTKLFYPHTHSSVFPHPTTHQQALSVGIFPYVLKLLQSSSSDLKHVLKLLQSSSSDLKPLLVFIWAKLLSVDSVSFMFFFLNVISFVLCFKFS